MNHPLFKQPNAENKNKINEVSFTSMLTAIETLFHSKCVFFQIKNNFSYGNLSLNYNFWEFQYFVDELSIPLLVDV